MDYLKHISKKTFEEMYGKVEPTTLSQRPINKKTGKPYTKNSIAYWRWWHGLSLNDKGVLADLEA